MALQQNILIDKIEIVENGIIQVRQRTDIYDDSAPTNIIASNYHRWSLTPGQDLTGQESNVIAIANAAWTSDVISAYKTMISTNSSAIPSTTPSTGA